LDSLANPERQAQRWQHATAAGCHVLHRQAEEARVQRKEEGLRIQLRL